MNESVPLVGQDTPVDHFCQIIRRELFTQHAITVVIIGFRVLLKNYLKIPALNLSCGHMHPNLIYENNVLMELVQQSKLTIIQFRPYHNYDKLIDKLKTPVIWLNLSEIELNQMINVSVCKNYPNQDDHLKIAKAIFNFILKHPNVFSYLQD